jgi:hypothetical protein
MGMATQQACISNNFHQVPVSRDPDVTCMAACSLLSSQLLRYHVWQPKGFDVSLHSVVLGLATAIANRSGKDLNGAFHVGL